MTKTGKTILMATVAVISLVGITVVGLGIWFFTSVIERVDADEERAARVFAEVRAQFAGNEPVMRMSERGPVLFREPPAASARGQLQNVRMMAWYPEDDRIASVRLPFWLLRMHPGTMNISASSASPRVRVSITAADLDRYGPAVVIDHAEEDGSRILIWTE
jgi:hypothetical protein